MATPTRRIPGLYYNRSFVTPPERRALDAWLRTLRPIWENRYSASRPPPEGEEQRRLLRPVYWLGSWQFACLGYYHPPRGTLHRAIRAEPFPPFMAAWVARAQTTARKLFAGADLPRDWALNTCLVNLYGSQVGIDGKRVDCARVGEHKDFEPGPVASVSLGERAMFQFVRSDRVGERQAVAESQWLDDGSLQIFGGRRWKSEHFHRVQRVDARAGTRFEHPIVEGFETRRVNFTFRYIPEAHLGRWKDLPATARADTRGYMEELARGSGFFLRELKA